MDMDTLHHERSDVDCYPGYGDLDIGLDIWISEIE